MPDTSRNNLGWIARIFALDLRSLALFRVGLGLVVLIDILLRWRDLVAHYTDAGILPRAIINEVPAQFRVYFLSGSSWLPCLLFTVTAIVALLFVVGCHTRVVAVVLWFLITSLQYRNEFVQSGGDDLIRMLLFWSMFLPLGGRFSIDYALDLSWAKRKTQFFGVGSIALLVQICFVYWFGAIQKTAGDEWWRDGTAVFFSLHIDMLVTPLGAWLRQFSSITRLVTFGTLWLEILGPFLLLVPIRNRVFRLIAIVAFGVMHVGMMLTMHWGWFPIVGLAMWTAILPPVVWDRFGTWARKRALAPPAIYYDADCGFCRKCACIVRTMLLLPRCRVRRAQTQAAITRQMEAENSWVIVDAKGVSHYRYDGFLTLLARSPLFGPLAKVLGWKPLFALGDWLYRFVSRRRPLAGRMTAWIRFRLGWHQPFVVTQVVAFVFLVALLWVNLDTLPKSATHWFREYPVLEIDSGDSSDRFAEWGVRRIAFPDHSKWQVDFKKMGEKIRLNQLAGITRLHQNWARYAPQPLLEDGWFVIDGRLADGRVVDLWTGEPLSWSKPDRVADQFPNARSSKLCEHLRGQPGYRFLQVGYAEFMCREWNARYDDDWEVRQVSIYFMRETTTLDPPPFAVEKVLVQTVSCDSE